MGLGAVLLLRRHFLSGKHDQHMPYTIGLAAIEISCRRGDRTIFRDLSFRLAPGQTLLVTGANGAGKTSLLRQVAGLIPLAEGDLRLEADATAATLPEL